MVLVSRYGELAAQWMLPKEVFWVVVGLFVALFLWALVSAVLYTDLFMAFNGLFFASTAAMIHHLKKLPLLFSEKGVYTPNDFIAWDQVTRHQWTGDSDSTHTLVLHLRRSVIPTKMLHIHWDSFEEVNDIVEEYGVSEKTEKTPRIF